MKPASAMPEITCQMPQKAAATAMPPILQSAAMRYSPADPDGASGLYVAAFQVGIMAGSLLGGVLYERAGEPEMLTASALLVAGALACVLVSRDLLADSGVAVVEVVSEK